MNNQIRIWLPVPKSHSNKIVLGCRMENGGIDNVIAVAERRKERIHWWVAASAASETAAELEGTASNWVEAGERVEECLSYEKKGGETDGNSEEIQGETEQE